MRSAVVLSLLLESSVSVAATKCAAGNTHKDDLTNLFCATSATDAASCDGSCCTPANVASATPTCGGVKPVCAFGTYAAGDDAWKNTKTTSKPAQQQKDCCKPSVTCDNTLYSCPAGYKKTSDPAKVKAKCSEGPKSCAVAGICCEPDPLTCGGYKLANTPTDNHAGAMCGATATIRDQFDDVSIKATNKFTDDNWMKIKMSASSATVFTSTCCFLKKTCASHTCKKGQIATAGQENLVISDTGDNLESKLSLSKCKKDNGFGGAGTCTVCCVNDESVNTCGNPTKAPTCKAGTYEPDDGSYYGVVIAADEDPDDICCVPTATCAAATCPAGYKKKANVDTLSCHGNRDKCVSGGICCEADKTTCGGLMASSGISCGYGTYDESALWTLKGDKKTSQATMDAWNSKPATKSADCCTAAASCSKEPLGTTTPAPLPVTTTPAAPIRRYSENDAVFQERQASRSASNLPLVAAGAFAGMAVLMLVQGLRSRTSTTSTRELIVDGDFSE